MFPAQDQLRLWLPDATAPSPKSTTTSPSIPYAYVTGSNEWRFSKPNLTLSDGFSAIWVYLRLNEV